MLKMFSLGSSCFLCCSTPERVWAWRAFPEAGLEPGAFTSKTGLIFQYLPEITVDVAV